MSYLVLARKYRPQTFADLVGQDHVAVTLTNAIAAGRLAHAYLFAGPRGCGKTTSARILAKGLNCEKGPTAQPCGECPSCVSVARGQSTDDVLEIDGASNRGIDQIRDLRDTVRYAPARSRHRIVIIDEAHQITDAGFNALLKTLEEPPPHAVFMMATTESQKIPPTILSRCQRFHLRAIAPAEIAGRLADIAQKEGLTVPPEALAEVARSAHGSLRDALSLLDQVIAFAPAGVTADTVRGLLGLLPRERVREFARTLREGSVEKTLAAVDRALADGFDLAQLARDLTSYYHDLLLAKAGVPPEEGAVAPEDLRDHALPELERALRLAGRAADRISRSESPRAAFELACLELTQRALSVEELLARLETLEKNIARGTPPVSPPAPPAAVAPAPPAARSTTPAVPSPAPGEATRGAWAHLLEEIGRLKPSLESFLLNAVWQWEEGKPFIILCRQEFQKQQLETAMTLVRDILASRLGAGLVVQCRLAAPTNLPPAHPPRERAPAEAAEVVGDEDDTSSTAAEEEPVTSLPEPSREDPASLAALDPGLKKVLETFPGRLSRADPKAN
jgi:DNA polymerase-3 subunit gamma/tau